MLLDESLKRQKQLEDYLYELSLKCFDTVEIVGFAMKLKDCIYSDNFRHHYSKFFPFILDIANQKDLNLEYLSNNLQNLRNLVEEDYLSGDEIYKGLYRPLMKLSDHINLEIARYNYYSKSEQKLKDIEKHNTTLKNEILNSSNQLEDARNKISSIQTDLIAVLSIFAAIVLTFSGGLNFLGSALISIEKTLFYKSVFFILLCGFVLFNSICILMYMISKITNKNIYANCKTLNCTCGENNSPKCNSFTRLRKRLPYIFWFNLLLILFIIVDLACQYRFIGLIK